MRKRFRKNCLHAWSFCLIASSIWLGIPGSEVRGESNATIRSTPIVQAIKKAEPAVVNIQGNKIVTNTTNGVSTRQEVNGMGTGVIIDRRGLIITNYHVVDAVEKIEVTLADGSTFIARLINYDPETDLAMIKINADRDLPVIQVGRSDDLLRGETVIAIGNPFGYQNTVTVGVISALHRNIPVNGSQEYTDLIQTNADINPGNSGGPLLNIDGEVIGINVAVRVGAQGIGFAIPVDNALEVMADLVAQYRTSGNHGLACQRIATDAGYQLVVREYRGQSNKSARDIRTGDQVRTVAGQSVQNQLELELALLDLRSGETVDIELERDGQPIVQSVVLQKSPALLEETEILKTAWERLGIKVVPIASSPSNPLGEEYKGGLKIVEIRSGSPASKEHLSPGDIVVGVMDWKTPNLKSLGWVLSNASFQTANSAKYYLVRKSRHLTVAMSQDRGRR